MRLARLRALFLAALIALPGAAHAQEAAPIVAPSQWMRHLAEDVLAPGYRALRGETEKLANALDALCEQPGAAAREAAQTQWKAAALALRRLSPLPYGPALEQRTLRKIDFWPTRTAQIEASIRKAPRDLEALRRIGFSAQGLPAIEYLLFDPKRKALEEDDAACRYAALVAHQAVAEVAAIDGKWAEWPGADAEERTEAEQRLLADGLNVLIGSTEALRLKYLEKPANSSSPQPDFDAWRSGATGAHLRAYFQGLRAGLQGGQSGVGLTAYLRGRGLLTLAEQLDARIEQTQHAIDALPEQFRTDADRNAARAAARELAKLHALLAEDIAAAIKVTVGFGESDGD
ncbi:MAG: imelysin family protein [Burkholderiales bacterium]|nr:imelysin family protein [Burkholderiales bacterium]PZN03423.1 MAG: hypothetical protein DIU74_05760 [Pseudomonadota bacterium]